MKKICLILLLCLAYNYKAVADVPDRPIILMIGASFENGKIPFNEGTGSPLFGASTNNGNFLDLGGALMWNQQLVINEAEAGATTFARNGCNPVCGDGYWVSYQTQLERAVLRVYNPATEGINAKYVVIGLSNDCLHADAFGIAMDQTSQCTFEQLDQVVNRLVAVGQFAISYGLIPIYSQYPEDYYVWDMTLLANLGIPWGMSEENFYYLSEQFNTRIPVEVPGAVLVNTWGGNFERIPGDPVHPNKITSLRGGLRIMEVIYSLEGLR